MRNVILAFLIGFHLQDEIFSNEDLLAKFHQAHFKIKDVRVQLLKYSPDAFNFFEIKAFKYNRTTIAHNATWVPKLDFKDDAQIVIQAYKFLSNQYRPFPIRFQENFKKFGDANAVGFGNILRCGNVSGFTFYKDISYHCCNFVLEASQFPPYIPSGKYRFDTTALLFNEEIMSAVTFCEIYTPIEYPKK